VLRDPTCSCAQLGVVQAVAPLFGVEVTPIDLRNADEMKHVAVAPCAE